MYAEGSAKDIASKIYALAKKRGFFWQAYEIYGGVGGLYDYGPLGVELKRNIISLFRKFYKANEGFFEIDCAHIAPQIVFKASGHVDEFTDSMVICKNCNQTYRADLIQTVCPDCKGSLSKPSKINLMFHTSMGIDEKDCYLRPETAQSMFYNFHLLYRFVREKLPFGIIQIGKGYRNEISPRQGIIRLREFNMAEAEVFLKPSDKKWHKFKLVADDEISLNINGSEKTLTVEEAVRTTKIGSEALAYFMAITKRFLCTLGLNSNKIRFRKHRQDEIAHYAMECWDCEYLSKAYDWVELAGIADRGCYDLTQHMKYSNADLTVFEKFQTPVETEKIIIQPIGEILKKIYGKDGYLIAQHLKNIDIELADDVNTGIDINISGRTIHISPDCYKVLKKKIKKAGDRYVANVIEPSYGLDRIIYAVLEDAYCEVKKECETYVVLKLKPFIAPIKAGVFPLMPKDSLKDLASIVYKKLIEENLTVYYDDTGSIGRRYARMDEIGTPYCITIDYESIERDDVTVRDRDTKEQVRVKITDLPNYLKKLVYIT